MRSKFKTYLFTLNVAAACIAPASFAASLFISANEPDAQVFATTDGTEFVLIGKTPLQTLTAKWTAVRVEKKGFAPVVVILSQNNSDEVSLKVALPKMEEWLGTEKILKAAESAQQTADELWAASALIQNGQTAEATHSLIDLATRYPDLYSAQVLLGNSCLRKGDVAHAKEYYETALSMIPKNQNSIRELVNHLLVKMGGRDPASKTKKGAQ
jgi:tetratricopeptide (TPR) repeat protein